MQKRSLRPLLAVALLVTSLLISCASCQAQRRNSDITGRWDIVVHASFGDYPSWLEVKQSGGSLVGYFVGQFGSVRPISRVDFKNSTVKFNIPIQFEGGRGGKDLFFEGQLTDGRLEGTTDAAGSEAKWSAVRAPLIKRDKEPKWGKPITLFNGTDLSAWKPRFSNRNFGWVVKEGLMANEKPGNDIVTVEKFTDFKLHAEFRYPKGSNSGIYLRGRYEVQIEDNYGMEPEEHMIGGVYGFLKPIFNTSKPAGEWQTYDITLVGRRVTIVLNGVKVVDRQEIPGITGGALDSSEGEAGPLLIQGDHGSIDFRNVVITPAK